MDLDKSFAKCCLVVGNEGKLSRDKKRAGAIVENIELHEHADVCRNVTYMAILKMSANGSIL